MSGRLHLADGETIIINYSLMRIQFLRIDTDQEKMNKKKGSQSPLDRYHHRTCKASSRPVKALKADYISNLKEWMLDGSIYYNIPSLCPPNCRLIK